MTKRGRSTGSGGASEVSRISRAVRGNFAAPSREWSCVWRRAGARHKATTKSRLNRARTNEGNAAAGGYIWERVAQCGREPVGMERVAQRGGEPVGNRSPFCCERAKCWGFFWVAVFIERAKWAVSWALLISALVHDDGLCEYFLK